MTATNICFPLRSVCKGKSWKIIGDIQARGSIGEVYKVSCPDNHFDYVLKYTAFNSNFQTIENQKAGFLNEVNMSSICSNYNICPKIIDSWLCGSQEAPTGGVFVVERMEATVSDVISNSSLSESVDIAYKLVEVLASLHNIGLVHNDAHTNNIMILKDKYKFIDMEYAEFKGDSLTKEDSNRDLRDMYDSLMPDLYYKEPPGDKREELMPKLNNHYNKFAKIKI